MSLRLYSEEGGFRDYIGEYKDGSERRFMYSDDDYSDSSWYWSGGGGDIDGFFVAIKQGCGKGEYPGGRHYPRWKAHADMVVDRIRDYKKKIEVLKQLLEGGVS